MHEGISVEQQQVFASSFLAALVACWFKETILVVPHDDGIS